MPKGIYDRSGKTLKSDIMDFVKFCFRDDIAHKLEQVDKPHILAVNLYKEETGKVIKPATAYKQRGKWQMINGTIYKVNNH